MGINEQAFVFLEREQGGNRGNQCCFGALHRQQGNSALKNVNLLCNSDLLLHPAHGNIPVTLLGLTTAPVSIFFTGRQHTKGCVNGFVPT